MERVHLLKTIIKKATRVRYPSVSWVTYRFLKIGLDSYYQFFCIRFFAPSSSGVTRMRHGYNVIEDRFFRAKSSSRDSSREKCNDV